MSGKVCNYIWMTKQLTILMQSLLNIHLFCFRVGSSLHQFPCRSTLLQIIIERLSYIIEKVHDSKDRMKFKMC